MDIPDNEWVLKFKIRYDIQFFAPPDPDKTEEATPRRKQKAREEGQVAYSKDLAMASVFLAVIVVLRFMIPTLYNGLKQTLTFFVELPNMGDYHEYTDLGQYITVNLQEVTLALAVILLSGVLIAVVLGLAQTKGLFVLKNAFKFDLKKINPIEGFKRMFSLRSVIELLKNLAKLAILGFIGYSYIAGIWDTLFLLPDYSISESLTFMMESLYNMSIQIAAALIVLGFADFFYQRWEHSRNIRMSKKEIKDERKDIEGNPQIKQKQRQKMAEMSQRRMMEEVPSATVVVTNPTHISIAIRFVLEKMAAPVVVAKGADHIALRIREIAQEYDVPLYENKPLAWELYERVEIGEEIPNDMYRAVAEVLAFIFQKAGKV
ncbi:MAG TPA: flagellar biosynthesis protein FlhB [Thermotogota bacterium]|nr:flagellar biosynthesis protein FlhB [Thermotogota bacterium]HPJ88928.1 flagellar biosynthesis protein FlhB [Thermotogota bacterium]HPR95308.1 flagellar biosynthesis protein FlhB [Thermotogota bacterium]